MQKSNLHPVSVFLVKMASNGRGVEYILRPPFHDVIRSKTTGEIGKMKKNGTKIEKKSQYALFFDKNFKCKNDG